MINEVLEFETLTSAYYLDRPDLMCVSKNKKNLEKYYRASTLVARRFLYPNKNNEGEYFDDLLSCDGTQTEEVLKERANRIFSARKAISFWRFGLESEYRALTDADDYRMLFSPKPPYCGIFKALIDDANKKIVEGKNIRNSLWPLNGYKMDSVIVDAINAGPLKKGRKVRFDKQALSLIVGKFTFGGKPLLAKISFAILMLAFYASTISYGMDNVSFSQDEIDNWTNSFTNYWSGNDGFRESGILAFKEGTNISEKCLIPDIIPSVVNDISNISYFDGNGLVFVDEGRRSLKAIQKIVGQILKNL